MGAYTDSRERARQEDTQCLHVQVVARARALRLGMRAAAADDFAMDFLLGQLQKRRSQCRSVLAGISSEAWLCRCADNAARNALRRERRRRQHEVPWPERRCSNSVRRPCEMPSSDLLPDECVIQGELRQRIMAAVAQLPAPQQALYEQYYLQGASVQDLCIASGRKPNAIWQALWELRCRLRPLLEEQGLDEAEAREYLAMLAALRGRS